MTVKQLKEALEGVDENLQVFINQENTNYDHSLSETAKVKSIMLYDGDDPMCEESVFSISDEF